MEALEVDACRNSRKTCRVCHPKPSLISGNTAASLKRKQAEIHSTISAWIPGIQMKSRTLEMVLKIKNAICPKPIPVLWGSGKECGQGTALTGQWIQASCSSEGYYTPLQPAQNSRRWLRGGRWDQLKKTWKDKMQLAGKLISCA